MERWNAEYNGHNMYGITEANSTSHALQTLRGKRPFGTPRSCPHAHLCLYVDNMMNTLICCDTFTFNI